MRVLKFGGKSLSTIEQINNLALKVSEQIKSNKDTTRSSKLILVVSAMGETTSELLSLATKVKPLTSDSTANRELDMLLASGERVSAALFALALQKYGVPAQSFTGSQAGILTSGKHNDSTIKEITPHRIDESIEKGVVPVIAGFQGVDPVTKDVTTLGRGGSDLTACALAHHYKCNAELYKTVGGIYSCDPNLTKSAKLIKQIDHSFLQSISAWGGKILHDKAADFIHEHLTPISFLSDDTFETSTEITKDFNNKAHVITCLDHILAIKLENQSIPNALETLNTKFSELQFKVLASAFNDEDSRFLISLNEAHKNIFIKEESIEILDDSLVAVSLLFNSQQESSFLSNLVTDLSGFEIKRFLETSKRLTFFIDQTKKMELVSKLHSIAHN